MGDISKITLPSGTTYDIKDTWARNAIDEMSGYTDFLGVTTTALTDGATTNPITINGSSVTAVKGNIVTYGSAEFIWNGTAWQAFGDLSGLGALAYKNSASGTVAVPKTFTTTVTPAAKNVSVTGTTAGTISLTTDFVNVVSSEPERPAEVTYRPTGNNQSSAVSGTCAVTATGTVATTYNGTSSGANGNFTPAGSVSTPTITVTPSTTSKYVATSSTGGGSVTAGSAASFTATVANETLTLGWTANTPTAVTLPSFSSQTIATGISSATSTQPTFTGTKIYAHHTFTGSSASGTISGTAAAQSWTGVGVVLSTEEEVGTAASFTGSSMTSTGSYTPATPTVSTTVATTENKTVTVQ